MEEVRSFGAPLVHRFVPGFGYERVARERIAIANVVQQP